MNHPSMLYRILSGLLVLIILAGCQELKEELEQDTPEQLSPVNPLDPQYSTDPPDPGEIADMNVSGPALILYRPKSTLKEDYIFPVYVLAKDMSRIVGVSAKIQFSYEINVLSISKDSTNFAKGADGMAFYTPPLAEVNHEKAFSLSATRLGGSDEQGFSGHCVLATIIARAPYVASGSFSFKEGESCQLRNVKNDTLQPDNLVNLNIDIDIE